MNFFLILTIASIFFTTNRHGHVKKDGMYSVRPAYRLLRVEWMKAGAPDTFSGNESPIWKKLWSLCAPPKVRVLWWPVIYKVKFDICH